MADASGVLEAPHVLEFPYTRSTGPVLGAFLAGLRSGRVLGVRGSDGRVLVPPQEYDPVTAHGIDELVEVATTGTVTTWTWNPTPKPGQPFDRPFAWALVRLDGADTPLLHALDVTAPDRVWTGMRVRIRWAEDRQGSIHDIVAFEPDDTPRAETPRADTPRADMPRDAGGARGGAPVGAGRAGDADQVELVTTPVRIEMTYRPGHAAEPFLRGTQRRELLGRRCSQCDKVYLPPRGVCSMCGAAFTDEQVVCGPRGTVATYLVVNVPFASQEITPPYTAVEVLFDGAHTTSQFLLLGTDVDDVRMGMRVQAVWDDADELAPTLSNVTHVEAIDEPDVAYEDLRAYA